jgi:hypothetical protein
MSWRIAFVADNSGQWLINGLRFATKEETEAYLSAMTGRLSARPASERPTIPSTIAGSKASWCR